VAVVTTQRSRTESAIMAVKLMPATSQTMIAMTQSRHALGRQSRLGHIVAF
jgi:hypothetical protein